MPKLIQPDIALLPRFATEKDRQVSRFDSPTQKVGCRFRLGTRRSRLPCSDVSAAQMGRESPARSFRVRPLACASQIAPGSRLAP